MALVHPDTGASRGSGPLLHISVVSASFLGRLQVEGDKARCSQPLKTHREDASSPCLHVTLRTAHPSQHNEVRESCFKNKVGESLGFPGT